MVTAAIITAIATVILASMAFAQIKASRAQSAASLEQSEASKRQSEAAERALSAQTTPLLSDVPYGIPITTGYQLVKTPGRLSIMESLLGRREPTYGDGSEISAYVDEHGYKDVHIDAPFRNVAPGTAIVDAVVFRTEAGREIVGASETQCCRPARSRLRASVCSRLPSNTARSR